MTVKAASSLPETMAFRGDAPVVARSRPVEAGGRADAKPLRVAIVHYWLVSTRAAVVTSQARSTGAVSDIIALPIQETPRRYR